MDKNETYDGDIIYRENDKILQLENMPDENVFNGDIGVIKYILYSFIRNTTFLIMSPQ